MSLETHAPLTYWSPRVRSLTKEEARIREIAYALKNPNAPEIPAAGAAMAMTMISKNLTSERMDLCPIPNSLGDISANLALCQAIIEALKIWRPDATVTCEARIAKKNPTSPQHLKKEGSRKKLLPFIRVILPVGHHKTFLVDNVIASGITMRSAYKALPGTGLVFTDARECYRILSEKGPVTSQFEAAEIRTLSVLRSKTPFMVSWPADIETYHRDYIQKSSQYHPERENLVVILMDTRLRIIGHEFIAQGSRNEACFQHAEVLRPVVASGAYAFILTHNHPSGQIQPSDADRAATFKLRDIAHEIGANLQDHIILGEPKSYYSFRDAGLV